MARYGYSRDPKTIRPAAARHGEGGEPGRTRIEPRAGVSIAKSRVADGFRSFCHHGCGVTLARSIPGERAPLYLHETCTSFASDQNHDLSVPYFQGIDLQFRFRILHRLTGLGIKLPAMPGTDYFVALDEPLSERAPAVQTYVVHGGDLPMNVGHADGPAGAGEFSHFSFPRQISLGGKLYQLLHEDRGFLWNARRCSLIESIG